MQAKVVKQSDEDAIVKKHLKQLNAEHQKDFEIYKAKTEATKAENERVLKEIEDNKVKGLKVVQDIQDALDHSHKLGHSNFELSKAVEDKKTLLKELEVQLKDSGDKKTELSELQVKIQDSATRLIALKQQEEIGKHQVELLNSGIEIAKKLHAKMGAELDSKMNETQSLVEKKGTELSNLKIDLEKIKTELSELTSGQKKLEEIKKNLVVECQDLVKQKKQLETDCGVLKVTTQQEVEAKLVMINEQKTKSDELLSSVSDTKKIVDERYKRIISMRDVLIKNLLDINLKENNKTIGVIITQLKQF